MLSLFFSAFAMGLIFNAAPGPVFAETVRHGFRGGFKPALAVQLGSLLGDATWAILGLAGIGVAMQYDFLRWPIGLAGTAYLLWLSYDSWQAARTVHLMHEDGATVTRQAWQSGVMLSLTNPQNLAYWAALGSAMGAVGVAAPTPNDYVVFFAGFMASSLVWCFFCAAIVNRLFRQVGARWARFTYQLCAVALLALALSNLRQLLQSDAKLVHKVPVLERTV